MKQVVVIGAGPAGSSAAYILSYFGFKVLLLEKQHFPRNKTCGGGITLRVIKDLPFSINGVIENSIKATRLMNNNKLPITIMRKSPMVYMVNRAKFDQYLLDRALANGAGIQFGKVTQIIQNNNRYNVILDNGSNIMANYIVGADGAQGIS